MEMINFKNINVLLTQKEMQRVLGGCGGYNFFCQCTNGPGAWECYHEDKNDCGGDGYCRGEGNWKCVP